MDAGSESERTPEGWATRRELRQQAAQLRFEANVLRDRASDALDRAASLVERGQGTHDGL